MRRPSLARTAHHEAAHAVAADALFPGSVRIVSIVRTDWSLGDTEWTPPLSRDELRTLPDRERARAVARRVAIVYLAGPCGERKFLRPRRRELPFSPGAQSDLRGAASVIADAFHAFDDAAVIPELTNALRAAKRIVKLERRRIEAVAALLVEHTALRWRDVAASIPAGGAG